MRWTPAVTELVPRLADDDAAVRDAAVEDALNLPEAELALVSDIERHLAIWRAWGTMRRQGDRLWLAAPAQHDDTVIRLVATLKPYSIGLYGPTPDPPPRTLPESWKHPGLVALTTVWPLDSVEGLDGLTDLRLDGGGLEQVPRGLCALSRLERLSLRNNKLTSLPAELGQLGALQELDVSDNQLTTLPDELGDLKHLRRLCAPRNLLRELPASLGRLESLEQLMVNANQITALPPAICRLPRLRSLRLAGNALTSLPDEIVDMPALVSLTLYRNALTRLPHGLRRIQRALRHRLYVTHNRLETLPEDMGDLRVLLVGHNPLRQLPIAQLEAMTRLCMLVVDDDAPLDEPSRAWLADLPRRLPRLDFYNDDPDADGDEPSHDDQDPD